MSSDVELLADVRDIVEELTKTRLVPDGASIDDGLGAVGRVLGQNTGLILRLAEKVDRLSREVDRLSKDLKRLTHVTGHNPRA